MSKRSAEQDRYCNWCESCQDYHGLLYICPSYPPDLKVFLLLRQEQFCLDLQNPEYIARQVDNGVPVEIIEVFQALAGVPKK